MPESCEFCGHAFAYIERVKTFVPTCECLQQMADEAARKAQRAQLEELAVAKVLALRLGVLGEYDRLPPKIVGWESPIEELLAGHNLVVLGPVGTSKTTLLKQVAYAAATGGLKVRGGFVLEILSTLKDMDRVKSYMAWLEDGHVLFLDDLDKMLGTQYEVERLMLLIDRYWAFRRSIVVSMNMTPTELGRKLSSARGQNLQKESEALLSRLMGSATVVELDGEDLREGGQ